jgi:MATE family multidrug resistance protein
MALLTLALPIIVMMVSRMLMGFIDLAMVKPLGTEAQAAISPAAILVFVLACVGLGVANSVQTFVAQADGRGDPRVAGAYAWQSLYIAGLCGLLTWPLATTTATWLGWVARVAGHSPEMTAFEIEYTRIALWSVPFAVLSIGFNGFFMGIRRPSVGMLAVIVSLVVNAVGNYLLIFGNLGFPRMGIAGAALATVIGWAARAGLLALAMLLPTFDQRYNTRRTLAWSGRKLLDMLRIGGPTTVGWLVDMGSWLVFMVFIIPPYGVAAVAASAIGLQYMHLSFMPAIGIGIALCSQVGFSIGEGQFARALQQARTALRVTIIYMGAMGLLFLVAGRPLMALLSDDPSVIRLGRFVLLGAAVFQVFDAMCITYMNALRGAGDTRWPAVMIFICCWILFIGGGLAAAHWLPQAGLLGPWGMCALYITVLGLLLRWRWIGGRWRHIRLFGPDSATAKPLSAVAGPTGDQPPPPVTDRRAPRPGDPPV